MAETTHPLRRRSTRAALMSIGMLIGLTLAPRVVGAETLNPPVDSESASVPATVATTSTSTSTSTSTTTPTTTPPPTTPITSAILPPLIVTNQPAEVGAALRVDRVQTVARRTQRVQAAAPATTGPELPFTGGGTVSILVAGLVALAIGALALWWGSRTRPELELAEVLEPGARE